MIVIYRLTVAALVMLSFGAGAMAWTIYTTQCSAADIRQHCSDNRDQEVWFPVACTMTNQGASASWIVIFQPDSCEYWHIPGEVSTFLGVSAVDLCGQGAITAHARDVEGLPFGPTTMFIESCECVIDSSESGATIPPITVYRGKPELYAGNFPGLGQPSCDWITTTRPDLQTLSGYSPIYPAMSDIACNSFPPGLCVTSEPRRPWYSTVTTSPQTQDTIFVCPYMKRLGGSGVDTGFVQSCSAYHLCVPGVVSVDGICDSPGTPCHLQLTDQSECVRPCSKDEINQHCVPGIVDRSLITASGCTSFMSNGSYVQDSCTFTQLGALRITTTVAEAVALCGPGAVAAQIRPPVGVPVVYRTTRVESCSCMKPFDSWQREQMVTYVPITIGWINEQQPTCNWLEPGWNPGTGNANSVACSAFPVDRCYTHDAFLSVPPPTWTWYAGWIAVCPGVRGFLAADGLSLVLDRRGGTHCSRMFLSFSEDEVTVEPCTNDWDACPSLESRPVCRQFISDGHKFTECVRRSTRDSCGIFGVALATTWYDNVNNVQLSPDDWSVGWPVGVQQVSLPTGKEYSRCTCVDWINNDVFSVWGDVGAQEGHNCDTWSSQFLGHTSQSGIQIPSKLATSGKSANEIESLAARQYVGKNVRVCPPSHLTTLVDFDDKLASCRWILDASDTGGVVLPLFIDSERGYEVHSPYPGWARLDDFDARSCGIMTENVTVVCPTNAYPEGATPLASVECMTHCSCTQTTATSSGFSLDVPCDAISEKCLPHEVATNCGHTLPSGRPFAGCLIAVNPVTRDRREFVPGSCVVGPHPWKAVCGLTLDGDSHGDNWDEASMDVVCGPGATGCTREGVGDTWEDVCQCERVTGVWADGPVRVPGNDIASSRCMEWPTVVYTHRVDSLRPPSSRDWEADINSWFPVNSTSTQTSTELFFSLVADLLGRPLASLGLAMGSIAGTQIATPSGLRTALPFICGTSSTGYDIVDYRGTNVSIDERAWLKGDPVLYPRKTTARGIVPASELVHMLRIRCACPVGSDPRPAPRSEYNPTQWIETDRAGVADDWIRPAMLERCSHEEPIPVITTHSNCHNEGVWDPGSRRCKCVRGFSGPMCLVVPTRPISCRFDNADFNKVVVSKLEAVCGNLGDPCYNGGECRFNGKTVCLDPDKCDPDNSGMYSNWSCQCREGFAGPLCLDWLPSNDERHQVCRVDASFSVVTTTARGKAQCELTPQSVVACVSVANCTAWYQDRAKTSLVCRCYKDGKGYYCDGPLPVPTGCTLDHRHLYLQPDESKFCGPCDHYQACDGLNDALAASLDFLGNSCCDYRRDTLGERVNYQSTRCMNTGTCNGNAVCTCTDGLSGFDCGDGQRLTAGTSWSTAVPQTYTDDGATIVLGPGSDMGNDARVYSIYRGGSVSYPGSLRCMNTPLPIGCAERQPCGESWCSNGGVCKSNTTCLCPDGFTGVQCEGLPNDLPDGMWTKPDQACTSGGNGGTSGISFCNNGARQLRDGTCVCSPGYTGPSCGFFEEVPISCAQVYLTSSRLEPPTTVQLATGPGAVRNMIRFGVIQCGPHRCYNDAVCYQGTCVCVRGFTGPSCGIPPPTALNLCYVSHDGQVVPAETRDGVDPYHPTQCGGVLFCLNGGACVSRVCACPDGYYGPRCETQSATTTRCPTGCVVDLQGVEPRCECGVGWVADMTSQGVYERFSECTAHTTPDVDPCNPGGRCDITSTGDATCKCNTGWFSESEGVCEKSSCEDNCNDRGRCVADSSGKFACVCNVDHSGSPMWIGDACETEWCGGLVCKNGGECLVLTGHERPTCNCGPGWYGATCEHNYLPVNSDGNVCSINPSQVSGQAVATITATGRCSCSSARIGDACELVKSASDVCGGVDGLVECNGRGTCSQKLNTSNMKTIWSCGCDSGWLGDACETSACPTVASQPCNGGDNVCHPGNGTCECHPDRARWRVRVSDQSITVHDTAALVGLFSGRILDGPTCNTDVFSACADRPTEVFSFGVRYMTVASLCGGQSSGTCVVGPAGVAGCVCAPGLTVTSLGNVSRCTSNVCTTPCEYGTCVVGSPLACQCEPSGTWTGDACNVTTCVGNMTAVQDNNGVWSCGCLEDGFDPDYNCTQMLCPLDDIDGSVCSKDRWYTKRGFWENGMTTLESPFQSVRFSAGVSATGTMCNIETGECECNSGMYSVAGDTGLCIPWFEVDSTSAITAVDPLNPDAGVTLTCKSDLYDPNNGCKERTVPVCGSRAVLEGLKSCVCKFPWNGPDCQSSECDPVHTDIAMLESLGLFYCPCLATHFGDRCENTKPVISTQTPTTQTPTTQTPTQTPTTAIPTQTPTTAQPSPPEPTGAPSSDTGAIPTIAPTTKPTSATTTGSAHHTAVSSFWWVCVCVFAANYTQKRLT